MKRGQLESSGDAGHGWLCKKVEHKHRSPGSSKITGNWTIHKASTGKKKNNNNQNYSLPAEVGWQDMQCPTSICLRKVTKWDACPWGHIVIIVPKKSFIIKSIKLTGGFFFIKRIFKRNCGLAARTTIKMKWPLPRCLDFYPTDVLSELTAEQWS